jgi:quinol monooxygenase YgiN
MNVFQGALIAGCILAAAPAALAQATDNQIAYGVTYIEVTPVAEAQTADLLRRVAAASRKEAGNRRYDVLQHTERRNQFAILESWNDVKAYEAHGGGAAMKQFRTELSPLRVGHYDERLDNSIDVGTPAEAASNRLNHFTTVEVWKDKPALDAHGLAAGTREFRENVGKMLGALYDDRRYRTLE